MKHLIKEEVFERLAISPRCLDNWVKIKKFPPGQCFCKRDCWTKTAVELAAVVFCGAGERAATASLS